MLPEHHANAIRDLITPYVTENSLVPVGQQLHVAFELRPAPTVPVVVVSSGTSTATSFSLSSLKLTARTLSALTSNNLETVADVLNVVEEGKSTRALLRYRNFGQESLRDLRRRLEANGFVLSSKWSV